MADQVAVLESIRDVLSGKDSSEKAVDAPEAEVEAPAETEEDEEEILDLTKMVNDDGSITEIGTEEAEVEADNSETNEEETKIETTKDEDGEMAETDATKGDDVLDEIDKLLADDAPAEETGVAFEEPAEANSEEIDPNDLDAMFGGSPAFEEPAAAEAPKEEAEPITDNSAELELADIEAPKAEEDPITGKDESLTSDESVNKAKSSIADLIKVTGKDESAPKPTTPSPSFRNGETVEDLVMESLKPMLAKWLDENLSSMVEEIVQKEIARIIPK